MRPKLNAATNHNNNLNGVVRPRRNQYPPLPLTRDTAEEVRMRRQLLSTVMAFALAMGMTTGAMAFEQGGDLYDGGFHSSRFEGVRGFSGWRHGDWAGRRSVSGYRSPYDS